ncbi:MAG TPA: carbohydrate porin [Woeseiaceae bacterium]|nr:carbohydrate porin [Woeseiaceae bacterium]
MSSSDLPRLPVAFATLRRGVPAFVACLLSYAPALSSAADALKTGGKGGTESAYSLEAAYTADLWRNTRGGLRKGYAYLDNLDIVLDVDGFRLWDVGGLQVYAHLLYNNGATFSDRYVGDAMGVSNIDAPSGTRVHEAWVEWGSDVEKSLAFRFGLYDLNSEFDTSDGRSLFIHSTHGVGHELAQTGTNGPSIFPNTSLGLRVAWNAGPNWRVLAAVLDGVPGDRDDPGRSGVHLSSEEGALGIAEAQWSRGRIEKASVGHWRYTAGFADLLATGASPLPERRDNKGTYGAIEIGLNDPGTEWSSSAFVRYGAAEGRINEFDRFLGIGLRFAGIIPGRPRDQVGLAFSRADVSPAAQHAATAAGLLRDHFEAAVELTWRAEINEWITLQPDIQYVTDPGADPALANALAFGLRVEISM